MNDTTESLVIEILRKLQGEMSILREDIRDIKARLSSIEARLAHSHADYATQSLRIDRLEDRLSRIEHRLDLNDQPSGH
jgi:predicted  nucleic acid-binding Zn-ribbon protein